MARTFRRSGAFGALFHVESFHFNDLGRGTRKSFVEQAAQNLAAFPREEHTQQERDWWGRENPPDRNPVTMSLPLQFGCKGRQRIEELPEPWS